MSIPLKLFVGIDTDCQDAYINACKNAPLVMYRYHRPSRKTTGKIISASVKTRKVLVKWDDGLTHWVCENSLEVIV